MGYVTVIAMVERYGAADLAASASPDRLAVPPAEAVQQAATGGSLTGWSAVEQTAASETVARIGQAIGQASSLMDTYLGRRYTLPIPTSGAAAYPLAMICGDIARWLLADDKRTDAVKEGHASAMRWLQDLGSGTSRLPGFEDGSRPAGGGLAIFAPSRRRWRG